MIDKRQAHSTMPKSRNQSRLNYSKTINEQSPTHDSSCKQYI